MEKKKTRQLKIYNFFGKNVHTYDDASKKHGHGFKMMARPVLQTSVHRGGPHGGDED